MWSRAVLLGFAGGLTLAVAGLLINFAAYLFDSGFDFAQTDRIGAGLICLAFAPTLAGAHALDRIAQIKKQRAVLRTAYREIE